MPKESSTSARVFYPQYDQAEVIKFIQEKISELSLFLPLSTVILFGSYARGNFTAGSDIDLLIVYRGEVRPDAFALAKKIIKLKGLEPHVYAEAEYSELKESLKAMTANGIVLFAP